MGRIVAIDYGQKRVGLAVTDDLKLIATSLTTVPANEIFEFLKRYVANENVECFVVGEPKHLNNTASDASKFIEPFIIRLKKEFRNIPVERMDERFTSKIAGQSILNSGLKKKARQNKSLVDRVSATIILQSFLELKSH
jgi:putative Holliday junction resolvase